MEFQTVTLTSESIKSSFTDLINKFLKLEMDELGEKYWPKFYTIMGKIELIASLVGEAPIEDGQSVYDYLWNIVKKYKLNNVENAFKLCGV
ncbi:hypothetical protein [Bacillus thuringiensis]|uniref:hypothetical protein n=1 Tax=Bacillus thuringiensis TaxID=1428 RepID=UPI0011A4FDD2|nr:hypothetical protein [Bacillus thuringiensis]